VALDTRCLLAAPLHVCHPSPLRRPTGTAKPLRKPITDIAGCCARAARGHVTAAPPSVAKNFRRSMWLAM
jgi:hypothetical protein